MSDLVRFEAEQKKFEAAIKEASNISLFQNAGAAFQAVLVVKNLREVLTDEVMNEVFMPLMGSRIGFLTDRDKPDKNGRKKTPYNVGEVRDCIIDAAGFGLLPTFNQMNIIAGKMYPTKEGYTALLKRLGVKCIITYGYDMTKPDAKHSEISFKANYEYKNEKNALAGIAIVPKTAFSSYDQQKGKAERRAKKALFEFLTGLDLGDSNIEDGNAEVVGSTINNQTDSPEETIKI